MEWPDRMNDNLGEIETRRRRLLWRAMHRGMRELDLLLGGFVRMRLHEMSVTELAELEAIVASADRAARRRATMLAAGDTRS